MEITLNSGYKMPIVGLGVWRMEKEGIRDLVINSIKIGYRHLDCAADYKNEAEVGEALSEAFKEGLVKREDLFVTTKLWNSDHGHVVEACKDSLKKLQLDYLDLYLVHFPVATKHTGVGTTDSALGDDGVLDIDTTISLETTWHDMEKLVSMGLVRSIGISNYDVFLTRDCLAYSKIKPAVNQIETHPYFQRDSLVKFCQKHGICVTAHTPLGGATANAEWFGTVSCLDDPALKLWNSDHGHVVEACKDSLKKLQLDYLDLYLVHFPVATKHTGVGTTDSALGDDGVLDIDTTISLETTWHDMEKLVSMGLVRSIGISNYDVFLTRDCLAYSKIKPAVNQIETHPYFQRDSLVKFCQKHGICVTAHTPLGGATANAEWFGTVSCLDDPALKEVAEKYKKTVAQVVLRWGIQRNTVVIPKTSKPERLEENFKVFDFELAKEDMEVIKSMDRKYRTNQPAKFWGIDLYA
ncbi:hypothetical protein F2Q69_00062953 [Brassica cretica]|uniref:NADP-dependent oxidoreductase domain-containing protein n=1 Tax=Brassica cretica TaxID=69181 RepID=A0A8S9RAN3_BRACR|nr:hypothetical protein F2Q69_00062953 [Brassica cretica]